MKVLESFRNRMNQSQERIRGEVVLVYVFVAFLLLVPSFIFHDSLIILGINLPVSLFVSLLITNKIVTGRFTNNGKLFFDD